MDRKTYIVNLIGGPCIGKTTLSALIFAKLKLHKNKYVAEYVQEYAKQLVWTKNFDLLNNQFYVSQYQYKLLKQMNGCLDYVVTDGPIIQGLYYNLHNKDNISNIDKTEKFILQCHSEFNNINIFLKRGNYEYESQGRLQTEEESREIDVILKHLLKQNGIEFEVFDANSEEENINKMIDYIISKSTQ
ncbi:AAA domain-containing protein (nadR/ttd14) [Fadolivirus algeromassiliense]|jgi:hypothetical protein|uniref:AAA domain-containing protein (NadR/ttd14) n=1 Tax=Fadolivirus FV1/VV64 TaxID=3070911 RepID=A0A7D3QX54_9VIRU|nr:AAA domain-containing protein (nadR/ttd14) [Fadolivirus algeromassiliense]QKF94140.1 AAA domain-containing protein (nadR/ttd14) [Fadolivirus FV1/VV64]